MTTAKILLLSGYEALSQAQWSRDLIAMCPEYEWHTIALPARYFSWRMRGSPLSLAAQDRTTLLAEYDLIVATSTIDLSVVQSIYQNLRSTPSLLYFHENQFAYPKGHQPQSVVDWQMVNLYSALRADRILFNSHYNQKSFVQGIERLFKKLPDLVPKDVPGQLLSKSAVVPVPIHVPEQHDNTRTETLKILWNHRWEWDKNPELLEAIIRRCDQLKLNVQFNVTGQQFRQIPEAFDRIKKDCPHLLRQIGFIKEIDEYRRRVSECDVVLSTAIHEFQGVAVMEAVALGCTPLLPESLSYPEYFSKEFLFQAFEDNEKSAKAVVDKIIDWQQKGRPAAPDMSPFCREALTPDYRQQIRSVLQTG